MNTYNEKEIIALLQDPARQKEAFECIVNEYSEQLYWQIRRMVLYKEHHFLMKMPMICYRIHLSKHGLI